MCARARVCCVYKIIYIYKDHIINTHTHTYTHYCTKRAISNISQVLKVGLKFCKEKLCLATVLCNFATIPNMLGYLYKETVLCNIVYFRRFFFNNALRSFCRARIVLSLFYIFSDIFTFTFLPLLSLFTFAVS